MGLISVNPKTSCFVILDRRPGRRDQSCPDCPIYQTEGNFYKPFGLRNFWIHALFKLEYLQ